MSIISVGKDGEECPFICPLTCQQQDIPCLHAPDPNGCETGGYCTPGKGKKNLFHAYPWAFV